MTVFNIGGGPGIDAKIESVETQIWWGHESLRILDPMPAIASASVDAGSTPTTFLRGGLPMGKITSSGLWTPWVSTATDGSEFARGVLLQGLTMLNLGTLSAEQKQGAIMVGGLLKAANVLNLDANVRRMLSERFIFDDDIPGVNWGGSNWKKVVNKAADYTVVAADNFTYFTASAAAAFTLPAIAKGLRFKFYCLADVNMSVVSAAGNDMIVFNDVAASSIAFSTAGNKIGAVAEVYTNEAGDKWHVDIPCKHTLTVA